MAVTLSVVLPATAAADCSTSIASSTNEGSAVTAKAYQDWRRAYVVPAGTDQLRVQRSSDDTYDTVSEGIAYGMLFAVYSNDKTTFDGLWRYAQAHFNQNGVMNWRIAANGTTTGYNGATDADEDMAAALVAADTQWGNYGAAAKKQIGLIKQYEVEAGSNVLKPGDAWGGSDLLNPSYLTPSYYDVFAQYTGDTSWNDVKTASYRILNAIATNTDSRSTGYIPDWSRADGYPANGMSYQYGYDGSRAPLRLALASAWSCDPAANNLLRTLNATTQTLDLTNLASSYNLDGSTAGRGDGTPLLAAAAAAATTSTSQTLRTNSWNALANTTSKGYFADSMRLFGLFVASGALPSPLSLKAVQPVATPPPTAAPKAFSMTSSAVTVSAGTPVNVSVLVGAPAVINGVIVDLEIYDASGNRVTQKFYDNQTISTTSTPYTVSFTPANTGTYTIRGGQFTANWATNLMWNNAISIVAVTAAPAQVVQPTPAPAPAPVITPAPSTPAPAPTPPADTTPVQVVQPASNPQPVTPAQPVLQAAPSLVIWWPGTGQTVRGVQPFKARLDNVNLKDYTMYWQVDGGALNSMADSYVDADHKESLVDVSGWNWRASQKYTVNFIAKNAAGQIIAQKSTDITVGH